MTDTTEYVFDGTSVHLTGRKAKKKAVVGGERRRARNIPTEQILVEVTPVSDVLNWKKWVVMEELFEVIADGTSSDDVE